MGQAGDAPEQHHVRRLLLAENALSLGDERIESLRRALTFRSGGVHIQRGHAHASGVHLRDLVAETVAAEMEDEAIVLHGVDQRLDAGNLDAVQGLDERRGSLRGDAARTPVDDVSVGVDGAEVAAGGYLALPQVDADAQGL